MKPWSKVAAIGILTFVLTLPARAVDGTWGGASGDYATPGNWAGSQAPDSTGTATFDANATYQVDWSASVMNGAAKFAAPGGQVTLNIGAANIWTLSSAFALGTNAGAVAKAVVSSGTLSVTNTAGNAVTTIGATNGTGVLAQTGGRINLNIVTNAAGGTITNSGGVMVVSGLLEQRGSLYVVNGGSLTNNGPQIAVMYGSTNVVSGAGSRLYLANGVWNGVAAKPGNAFRIDNGGQLECPNGFAMTTANANSGADTMFITDPGTLATIGGTFHLGARNAASVVVSNKAGLVANGTVGFQTIVMGNNSGSGQLLLVTGTGSYVRVTGNKDVTIGNQSSSSRIEVRDGATWTNVNSAVVLRLSQNNGSNNKLLITDPGTIFDSASDASVAGCSNVATNDSITVSNSATATFRDVYIGDYISPYANYVEVVNGASLTVRNFLFDTAGNGSSNNWLRVSGGTFTASGTVDLRGGRLMVEQNGAAKITGLLTLTGGARSVMTLSDGAVTNGGLVVGSDALVSLTGASHVQVNGNFTNNAGASTVKFVATPSAVGRIDVTGAWTNSATALLNVNLTGYTWPAGSSVTLATFGSMPTPYAANNITVTPSGAQVVQSATDIKAILQTGTMLSIR